MRWHYAQVNPPWSGCCKRILENRCSWCYQHQHPWHPCSSEQNSLLRQIQASMNWWQKYSLRWTAWNLHLLCFLSWQPPHRKAKVVTVGLCNGVWFIGGKLVGRIGHGNQQIWGRSLMVWSQVTRYFVGFVISSLVEGIKGGIDLEVLEESWAWAKDNLAGERSVGKLR